MLKNAESNAELKVNYTQEIFLTTLIFEVTAGVFYYKYLLYIYLEYSFLLYLALPFAEQLNAPLLFLNSTKGRHLGRAENSADY